MTRLRSIIFTILIGITALLFFLVLFDSSLQVPAFIQVFGRMHPMILHFPIVLIFFSVITYFFLEPKKIISKELSDTLILLTAFFTVLTSLFGLFLSQETGYEGDTLVRHKWFGIVLSALTLCWYLFRDKLNANSLLPKLKWILSPLLVIIVVIVAHLGANITHGEDFVFAPLQSDKQKPEVSFDQALVFADVIQPILDAKCVTCHNTKKSKGELIMETMEDLLKGGKSGALWDSANPTASLLLKRIHLPETDKKHMPPPGKPSLTDEEMVLLGAWINSGASFTQKLSALPETDTLRLLAASKFDKSSIKTYTFQPADAATIAKLNNSNRVITAIALQSPALLVHFYNAPFYNQAALKELEPVGKQIVELVLNKMPVTDEDLKVIAGFTNLERLHLNFTNVTTSGIDALQGLKKLEMLSLTGTKTDAGLVNAVAPLKSLKNLVAWNTGLEKDQVAALKKSNPGLLVELGYKNDTLVMQLPSPVILNEETTIIEPQLLKMKHYINGAVIRYTTDGTEPDSLKSKVYDGREMITGTMAIKAKAFKPGWHSSALVSQYFYKSTYRPDSVVLTLPSDPKYGSTGPKALFDLIKGENNFAGGQWLGYQNNDMEALAFFNKPVTIKELAVSTLSSVSSYIFPPLRIEVWGGTNPKDLKLIGTIAPKQPAAYEAPQVVPFYLSFEPKTVQCIKLKAVPVSKLPKWHSGKGEKGWAFIDEVFIN